MKKINIIYWIFTGLLLALMLSSVIGTFADPAGSKAMVTDHLGYPKYFGELLAVAKALGIIALLIPGYPTIKEWAYAGFAFDLIFACCSFIAVGDPVKNWAPFIIFFAIFIVSYIYFHKKLKAKALGTA